MKKVLLVVLCIVLAFSIVACGSESSPIVGVWEPIVPEGTDEDTFKHLYDYTLEFKANGSFTLNGGNGPTGTYKVDDDKVILESEGESIIYTLTDNTLIDESGLVKYKKQ